MVLSLTVKRQFPGYSGCTQKIKPVVLSVELGFKTVESSSDDSYMQPRFRTAALTSSSVPIWQGPYPESRSYSPLSGLNSFVPSSLNPLLISVLVFCSVPSPPNSPSHCFRIEHTKLMHAWTSSIIITIMITADDDHWYLGWMKNLSWGFVEVTGALNIRSKWGRPTWGLLPNLTVSSACLLLQTVTHGPKASLTSTNCHPISVLMSHCCQEQRGVITWQWHYYKINVSAQPPVFIKCHFFLVAWSTQQSKLMLVNF